MHSPRILPPPPGAFLCLCALAGCDAPTVGTQVLVVVDSDLAAGSELTRINVGVFDRAGSAAAIGTRTFQLRSGGEGALSFTLPLSFAIAPASRHSARDFKLVVTGRGPLAGSTTEEDVVEQKVIASFVPGESLRLGVYLARSCYGNPCRDQSEELTCVLGDCVPVPVLTDLPRADDSPLAGYVPPARPDAGAPADAAIGDTDSGAPGGDAGDGDAAADAGPPDADVDAGDASLDAGVADASVDAAACELGFAPGPNGVCVDIDECSTLGARCDRANFPCEQTAPAGYICRGQLADWAMPANVNGGQSRFEHDPNTTPGTVIDRTTGLQWERTAGTAQLTYANAVKYCDDLVLAELTDWRMPAAIELFSVLDETRLADPNQLAIDGTVFLGTVNNTRSSVQYWTSTPDPGAPLNVRQRQAVRFSDANVGAVSETALLPVRCVRRPVPVAAGFPEERFVGDIPGAWRDRRTGLIWQSATGGPFAWGEAVAYCAAQNGAGMLRPFRLPGYKELRTLVDSASPSNSLAFIDALGNFTGRSFWSGSEYGATGGASAYVIDFLYGNSGVDLKTKTFFARCVRSSVE